MGYLKSSNVYVYPCANRSNKYATSKFINEKNIISNVGKRPNVDGFVISYNDDIMEFNLGGYYFRVNFKSTKFSQNNIYVYIKLGSNTINSDDATTTSSTSQLVSMASGKQLDDDMENGDTTFYGLYLDGGFWSNYTYILHILTKVENNYIVPSESYGSVKSSEILLDSTAENGAIKTLDDLIVNKSTDSTNIVELNTYLDGKIANSSAETAVDFGNNVILANVIKASNSIDTDTLNAKNINTDTLNAKDNGRIVSTSLITNKAKDTDDGGKIAVNFEENSVISNEILTPTLKTHLIDLSNTNYAGNPLPNAKGIIDGYTEQKTPKYVLKIDANNVPIMSTLAIDTIYPMSTTAPVNIDADVQMKTGSTLHTSSIDNTLDITTSNLTSAGTTTLTTANIATLTVTRATTLNSTLDVTGKTTLNSTLEVTKETTLGDLNVNNVYIDQDYYLNIGSTEISEDSDSEFGISATKKLNLYAQDIKISSQKDITFSTQRNGEQSTTSINEILDRLDSLGFKEGVVHIYSNNNIPAGTTPTTSLIKQGNTVILNVKIPNFNISGGRYAYLQLDIDDESFGPINANEFSFTYYQNVAGTRYLRGGRGTTTTIYNSDDEFDHYEISAIPNTAYSSSDSYYDISFQIAWRLN